MASPYFNDLMKAYREVYGRVDYLSDFFYELAVVTGNRHTINNREYWLNDEQYPHDIHLVYLYFRRIANANLDMIEAWHSPGNLHEHHLKEEFGYAEDVGSGAPNYGVHPGLVKDRHPSFSDWEWYQLSTCVTNMVNIKEGKKREEALELQRRIDTLKTEVNAIYAEADEEVISDMDNALTIAGYEPHTKEGVLVGKITLTVRGLTGSKQQIESKLNMQPWRRWWEYWSPRIF